MPSLSVDPEPLNVTSVPAGTAWSGPASATGGSVSGAVNRFAQRSQNSPSNCCQPAIALPAASPATTDPWAAPEPVSMDSAVPHPVPTTYRFAQMLLVTPSQWRHVAMALPLGSTATCGVDASPVSLVSTSPAVPHPVPTTYRFAQVLANGPLTWTQTAAALPLGPTATCGAKALAAPVSMGPAVPQPVPTTYWLDQMSQNVAPSHCCQTATALPAASTATLGELVSPVSSVSISSAVPHPVPTT